MSMMWVGIGSAAAGLAGNLYTSNKNAKALKGAQAKPLDIAQVISDARENAASNYRNSFALESQFRPGTAALRGTVDNALGALDSGRTPGFAARDSLLGGLGESKTSNPLLDASVASIFDNLKLGGTLGRDVQQQAAQAALEKGGAAGISGSGAARGLVARDLGLTSLGLLQQRQAQGLQAGSTMAQLNLQDFLGRMSAAQAAAGQDTQRTSLLASIIDARALPESGLSPGGIANLYVGDKNAQDQQRMNLAQASAARNTQDMNALLGFGTQAAGAYFGAKGGTGSAIDTGLNYV
jgi:hypothetical protein